MSKRAFVISGGGSKGAFAVGVIEYLSAHFPALTFDVFVGTSVGSLIVPFAATGELDLLHNIFSTITTNDVIIKGNVVNRLLAHDSLYDASPLARMITKYYDDNRCNILFQLQKEIYCATTCLQTARTVYFATKDMPIATKYEVEKLNTPDELRRALMASSCQPVFMPPIEVHKGALPVRQFVDGGVREYAGVQLAIDAGADEIFVVLLTAKNEMTEEKTFIDAFTILERTLDIFSTDVGVNDVLIPLQYNRALKYIAAVQKKMLDNGVSQATIDNYFNIPLDNPFAGKKPLKIYIIRPDAPLGGGPGGLNFDPVEMKGMIAMGQNTTARFMANLPPEGSSFV